MNFNPILLDIAEQVETERLTIRAVMPGDGAVHYAAIQESIVDLRRFLGHLPWIKEEPSVQNSEKHCRNARSNFIKRESLTYFIYSIADGSFIGALFLLRIDWDIPRFEIGYWCRSGAQRKGYIAEAVSAMTEFAFSQLAAKRVEIRTDAKNVGSWKVAESSGFTLEGTLRNWDRDWATGELCDLRIYAKIA
jgi:hypothetical protein